MLMELEWKMLKTENGLTRTGFQCEKCNDGNETNEKKKNVTLPRTFMKIAFCVWSIVSSLV